MKKAVTQFLIILFTPVWLSNCSLDEGNGLDSSIPRLQTPIEEIAYLRTKWLNNKHIETVFYDHQNRIREMYSFGRSNSKWLNQYEGNNLTTTIYYYHSDSSGSGYIYIDTLRREFNSKGQLVAESTHNATMGRFTGPNPEGFTKRYLSYTSSGDTIIKKLESSYQSKGVDSSQVANINQWERDEKQRLTHQYRLYVFKGPSEPRPDTIYHFSKRFAYNASGKLKMTWFDYMYLWRFYSPAGPDTIWYQYDARGRLIAEKHRYTTDMRNKQAIDTTGRSAFDKQSIESYKKRFYTSDSIFTNNDRIDQIRYHYEQFDPARHSKLKIPNVE